MTPASDQVFMQLVSWINSASDGGYVNPSLTMRGSGTNRGIFTTKSIARGTILVSLPGSRVLSGETMPEDGSSWLRCLGAWYREQGKEEYRPYFSSLPKPDEYEALLAWSDEEISSFLRGTALGKMCTSDRETNMTERRYQEAVRPYLLRHNLLPSGSEEDSVFRTACMCLSTRGFNLLGEEGADRSSRTAPNGPLLLPLIDLINHDPSRKCTTLKRDTETDKFVMIAERDITQDEQIFHSYGEDMTSAQLLQTFGFVSEDRVQRAMVGRVAEGATPAVLTKAELITACQVMSNSGFPKEIESLMQGKGMKDDETWSISSVEERRVEHCSDDLLIEFSNPLSDELISLCTLLLLPDEVYRELTDSEGTGSVILDETVLNDFFLGKLVCQVLLLAIQHKLGEYKRLTTLEGFDAKMDDQSLLKEISEIQANPFMRAKYGLVIRSEESACLSSLREKVAVLMDSLDRDTVTEFNEYDCTTKKRRRSWGG